MKAPPLYYYVNTDGTVALECDPPCPAVAKALSDALLVAVGMTMVQNGKARIVFVYDDPQERQLLQHLTDD
jgi:hypothetical protein